MECAFDFDICRICRSSLQKVECPQGFPRRFLKSGRHGGACLLLLSVGSAWCLGHECFANLVFDARLGEDLLGKTHGCDFDKTPPKASDILYYE